MMMTHQDRERERLRRLSQFGILDTPRNRYFDVLAQRALRLLPGTAVAAISLVDHDRQWFKSIIGLDLEETAREVSFCAHTIREKDSLVVSDALKDRRFSNNPLVTEGPKIRFYAGVRLIDGVGALCVIGLEPREVTTAEMLNLKTLAQYADIQLLAHGALYSLGCQSAADQRHERCGSPMEQGRQRVRPGM